MAAVVLFAMGVFALGLAGVLGFLGEQRLARLAVVAAIVLAISGGGLAIAGAIRWRGCFRETTGVDVYAVGNGTSVRLCPQRTFGIRDPF